MSTESQIAPLMDLLRSSIDKKPPFIQGVIPLPPETSALYYGSTTLGRIDLRSPQQSDLQSLAHACAPVTFGLDQQDVFDETYRKAGQLDADKFAFNLDIMKTGIANAISTSLLEGHECSTFKADLYKLNVYSEGSFFKPHKDTPRSDTMFGSLVLVLPTPHESGVLVLRHEDKEWSFDLARLLKEQSQPSIAYIAFFGDVEHEVLTVTSGHRVTITYNLYFDSDNGNAPPGQIFSLHSPTDTYFHTTLTTILNDSTFLPDGGFLGFTLCHEYPVCLSHKLDGLLGKLKGADTILLQACQKLVLEASSHVVYAIRKRYRSGTWTHIMFDYYPDFLGVGEINMDIGLGKELKQLGGVYVRSRHAKDDYQVKAKPARRFIDNGDVNDDSPKNTVDVWWVTQGETNTTLSTYIAYGNESTAPFLYGHLSLMVKVGKFGERSTVAGVQ